MGRLQVKRIYVPPARTDGFRVLVDRLWPRGIAKQRAALDLWMKSIAPSPELAVCSDMIGGHTRARCLSLRNLSYRRASRPQPHNHPRCLKTQ